MSLLSSRNTYLTHTYTYLIDPVENTMDYNNSLMPFFPFPVLAPLPPKYIYISVLYVSKQEGLSISFFLCASFPSRIRAS